MTTVIASPEGGIDERLVASWAKIDLACNAVTLALDFRDGGGGGECGQTKNGGIKVDVIMS